MLNTVKKSLIKVVKGLQEALVEVPRMSSVKTIDIFEVSCHVVSIRYGGGLRDTSVWWLREAATGSCKVRYPGNCGVRLSLSLAAPREIVVWGRPPASTGIYSTTDTLARDISPRI